MATGTDHRETHEIILHKPSRGDAVIAAVNAAVKKVGGEMEQKIHDYYAPTGTHHVGPMTVTLHGRIGVLFGREFTSERIDLRREDYEKLTLYCKRHLPGTKFNLFAAAVNESLR